MTEHQTELFEKHGLTEAEQHEALAALAIGCDANTVAKLLEMTAAQWTRALDGDPSFLARVRKSEARAELHYLKCIYEAAKTDRNWQAARWWLETQRPHLYAYQNRNLFTAAEAETLVELIAQVVTDKPSRDQLLHRIKNLLGR